jgi:hypothetical protein
MIRRAVVLVVFIGLIVAVVSGVKALFSGGTSTAASSAPDTTVVSAGAVDPADTGGSAVAEVTTTAGVTSTTIADAGKTPTAADPARIYLAGDSDAGTFAPFLERQLESTGVTKLTVDYKVSSGLARPDFFDWPARIHDQVPLVNPDIVVVTFGGNDGQPIHGLNKNVDTPEWREEYGKRVSDVMDYLSADGRTLIWVGIPNAGSPSLTARLEIQNQVVKEQIAKHPNVVFVDAWDRFTGIDGGYAAYVVDPRDGESKPVRGGDGFHLNTDGAEILANDISQAVIAELRNRGANI